MHFIKDLFEGNQSEHLHNKLIRYSRGEFVGPLLKIRVSKANLKVYASFHFVDELLGLIADYLGNKEVHIKGTLLWNRDLMPELNELGIMYSKVSKARGIFKYTLDNDVLLKDFYEKLTQFHLLVNFKTDEISYTTKSSFPKPNKEFGPDFCKLTLPIEMKDVILKEFVFDVENLEKVKLIEVKHELTVTEINLPEGETNFEIARKMAKRVGLCKRLTIVDGAESRSESEFNV